MTLVSSVWREVTQKLGLLKALIGFCTIAGEESKRKAEPRTRSASRLSLAEMKRFELLRRFEPTYRISSFIGCVSASASFVLGAKPQKHWIFHAEAPKKPNIPGKFECVGKCAKIRIFGKNCRASGTCSDEAIHGQSYWQIGF